MYGKFQSVQAASDTDGMDSSSQLQITSLDEMIAEIKKIFEADDVDIDYVKYVMSSYKSNPKDWKKFAIFDQHR